MYLAFMWGRKDFNLKDNSRREKVIKLVLHCLWRFAQVPLESKFFLRCSVRITRQKSLKRVQSLTLHRGSHIVMATEITQGGFDGELERECGSQHCQPLCFRLSPPERGFSL